MEKYFPAMGIEPEWNNEVDSHPSLVSKLA